MTNNDNEEFQNALREIAAYAPDLPNPFDRVRCSEWAHKLSQLGGENEDLAKLRNQYIQFLRIQVRHAFLHGPFLQTPPSDESEFISLGEILGESVSKQVPYLKSGGKINPMVCQQSPDGMAFVSTQQIEGGGVLCYMAVSPEGLKF